MVRPANEILRIARMLLSDVRLWAQGARARDIEGHRVQPHDPRAVCWSVSGAIAIASNPHGITPPKIIKLLDEIVKEWKLVAIIWPPPDVDPAGCPEIWESSDDFNDARPHRFILALLDEAIERLEK